MFTSPQDVKWYVIYIGNKINLIKKICLILLFNGNKLDFGCIYFFASMCYTYQQYLKQFTSFILFVKYQVY